MSPISTRLYRFSQQGIMKAIAYVPLLAGVGYALPQACKTTTEQVIVPTSTATYLSTYVTTVHATTPQNLGTFTDIVRESSTKTLQTLTSVETDCTANGTMWVMRSLFLNGLVLTREMQNRPTNYHSLHIWRQPDPNHRAKPKQ